jgi:hypothetical protein
MARKLSIPGTDSREAQLRRLMSSIHYPLSPEGKRVLAAAKVGLQLIRREASPERKVAAKKKPASSSNVIEENFPQSIREMLVQYRKQEEKNAHRTLPLRPDRD